MEDIQKWCRGEERRQAREGIFTFSVTASGYCNAQHGLVIKKRSLSAFDLFDDVIGGGPDEWLGIFIMAVDMDFDTVKEVFDKSVGSTLDGGAPVEQNAPVSSVCAALERQERYGSVLQPRRHRGRTLGNTLRCSDVFDDPCVNRMSNGTAT
jgi:hypothetical protein